MKFLSASSWKGIVQGDSCIIIVNRESHAIKLLSSEDKDFDSYPDYVDSNPINKGKGYLKDFEGIIDHETSLLLVSDPFSEFLSKNRENANSLLEDIFHIESHNDYLELVDRWRGAGMHNDDSTLIIVEYDGDDGINVACEDNLERMIQLELNPQNEKNTQVDTTAPTDKEINGNNSVMDASIEDTAVPVTFYEKYVKGQEEMPSKEDFMQKFRQNQDSLVDQFLEQTNVRFGLVQFFYWHSVIREMLREYNKFVLTKISKQ